MADGHGQFTVVMNLEGQYSTIPNSWPIPHGWHRTGCAGSREECVRFVNEHWTDMRPASLRNAAMQLEEPSQLLHGRFGTMAKRHPDHIAVAENGHRLTYEQLDRRSNQLANVLIEKGIGPEQIVGIHLERSPDAIVAMLAILKAGAAYLVLPVTDYPLQSLQFMHSDSQAATVITRQELLSQVRSWAPDVVLLDDSLHAADSLRHAPLVHPLNLAYVIYTSASTGTPKGVAITHASAVNLVDPRQQYVHFGPHEVILQLASMAFDASAFEIWGALANGGTLVIANLANQFMHAMGDALTQHGVTTVLLFPRVLSALMKLCPDAICRLRRLIVGGDVMQARVAHDVVERTTQLDNPGCLRNVYGPTEATTLVSFQPVQDVPADSSDIPLGKAIDGCSLYCLDSELRPVQAGGKGELFIGGIPVARGYVGAGGGGMTSLSFVPDPYAEQPGRRMYATGDIVRVGDAGELIFLERRDRQVKVRGYRVSLQEIERMLMEHEDVEYACVEPIRSSDDGLANHLIAYIHVRHDDITDRSIIEALKRHASTSLPKYKCPRRYVIDRGELPLKPAGKIDRAAFIARNKKTLE